MRAIVQISLRFPYLVIFIALVFVLLGISRIALMPVDVFPEFAPPRVEIQTPSLGLSSVEVEALVTVPLEESFNGLPGLDIMRSKSVEQLSSIVLIFSPGTNLIKARQLVQERLALATPGLPTWASPPAILPPLSSTARTLKIGISSKKHSVMDLSMTTYWKIRQRLLQVPGVANVAIWGERIEMLQVQVDPQKLAVHAVSTDDIIQVTSDTLDVGLVRYSKGSVVGTGGFVETPNQRLGIQHMLPVLSPSELAAVPINTRRKTDGTALNIGDVAVVVKDTWPMIGDAVVNDGPGLLLIVEKFPWANTVEVTKGVEEAIELMRPGLPDIDIDTTIFRPATFVEAALSNLLKSLFIGSLLVVVVLLLFLWDFRIALISATIIPVTAVITLLVLSFFGVTLNVMVLAGLVIAIGAVVDDAIVDVENIVRRLRQSRLAGSKVPTASIVLEASVEVRNAIIYASLIEMTALLPVFFMEGLSGAFFQPLAQAYVIATLVSPIIALTLTPALIFILLDKAPIRDRVSPFMPLIHKTYDIVVSRTIRKPHLAYITVGILTVVALVIWPNLERELLPSFKERDFLMHWVSKPGTSHPEMVRISTRACQELRSIPGIRNCGSHIGQALLMDEVYGIYFGENWVSIDPKVDYDETLSKIHEMVDGYPGLYRDVQTFLKERIREVLTGSSSPIVIRIYGQDLEILRAKADEVKGKLLEVDGLTDVHVEFLVDIPQIEIEVDLARARAYGIKPGDVRRAAAYMIAGEEVGDMHTANRTYDVQVWSTPESRRNLTDIRNLLIDTQRGTKVQLGAVADVRIVPVANAINRENLSRRINIEADIKGRKLGSVVFDVEHKLREVVFPQGYHPELLGEYAERTAASARIFMVGLAAVVVIFFLLRISLSSWHLAIMSFLGLPMALAGGVLAAYFISGGILSLGSLVGFLTILGIAARNGIMLISHYQHLQENEGEPFGMRLVLRGAKERIAPILMTAMTAGLALVPLILAGNIAGNEIEHPMAIVILGGLVSSTLLNLFIVPALYLRFGNRDTFTDASKKSLKGRIPNMNTKTRRVLAVLTATAVILVGLQYAVSYQRDKELEGVRAQAEKEVEHFDPNNFTDSTIIDNVWLPHKPGVQFVYEGVTTEEGTSLTHRMEYTVTDVAKEINGVSTVVVLIVDYSDDEVVEKEIAFYAEDKDGTVWYLGEYPEEYVDGKFVRAPTWIAGIAGARAGIKMWADPKPSTPRFFQGWGPAVDWTDYGIVEQVGQDLCIPMGCYKDVLVIAESSLNEKDAFQVKQYARGIGNVKVTWRGKDASQEELMLVDYRELDKESLSTIHDTVLALEKRAYEISKDVYGLTKPIQ